MTQQKTQLLKHALEDIRCDRQQIRWTKVGPPGNKQRAKIEELAVQRSLDNALLVASMLRAKPWSIIPA